MLPQEPWLSLDPLMRADGQVAEAHVLLPGLPGPEARARATADLEALGLGGAGGRYPHQLSGGMAQRVAIAAARAGGAQIVIADEPTKGLDAARRDDVANLLLTEMGESGSLLVITHDLALAQRFGGLLIVLRAGAVVEHGATRDTFAAPKEAYTKLVAPEHGTVARAQDAHPFAFQKLSHDPVAAFPRKRSLGKTLQDTQGLTKGQYPNMETLLDAHGLDLRLLAHRPGAVSGGELQRFTLLRILLGQPSSLTE